jgi:hypothetical protein
MVRDGWENDGGLLIVAVLHDSEPQINTPSKENFVTHWKKEFNLSISQVFRFSGAIL